MNPVEEFLKYVDKYDNNDKEILLKADKVILPGVGAFGSAMEKIHRYELYDVIHEIVKKGKEYLAKTVSVFAVQ